MMPPTAAITPATVTPVGGPAPSITEPHVNRGGGVNHRRGVCNHRSRSVNRGRRSVDRRRGDVNRRGLINYRWRTYGYTKTEAKTDSGLGYRHGSEQYSS